jgi:O-antigen ligase
MWSMQERLNQNASAWKMFTESPLVGKGPGYFYRHYIEYRRGEWFNSPPPVVTNRTAHQVHNDYIQILAEGGAAAALPLLAAFVIFMATLYRQLRRLLDMEEPDNRTLIAIGSAGGFLVLAINGLASFPFHVAPLAWTAIFWAAIFFRTAENGEETK